jgi:hypothetical protein
VKLADFQKYLRALADALAAAKGTSKELTEAADALTPFAHQTMAEFAAFLRLAEAAYRETGRLPAAPPAKEKPKSKSEKVTLAQLQAAIQSVRDRVGQGVLLTRAAVGAELARFEALPAATLAGVVSSLGYKSKPKNRKVALELIVGHLLAGTIANARAQI